MAKRKKGSNFPKPSIYTSIRAQQKKSLERLGWTDFYSRRSTTGSYDYYNQPSYKPTVYPSSYSTLRRNESNEPVLKFRPVGNPASSVKVVVYSRTGERKLVMLNERQTWETCNKFLAVDNDGRFRKFVPDDLPAGYRVINVSIACLSEGQRRLARSGGFLKEESMNSISNQIIVPVE